MSVMKLKSRTYQVAVIVQWRDSEDAGDDKARDLVRDVQGVMEDAFKSFIFRNKARVMSTITKR